MTEFLATGTLLGLSAGVSPGPLLTLVIAETLRRGVGAGIRVALAPFLTDLPIIVVSLVVLARLAHYDRALGVVSLAGGVFVLYLGYECVRAKEPSLDDAEKPSRSLRKGVLVNLLSPHPYLFWLTVGAPTVLRAKGHSLGAAAAFVGGFYFCLVGSKVLLAWLVGRAGTRLRGRAYPALMRALGVGLLALALLLFRDAGRLLGLR